MKRKSAIVLAAMALMPLVSVAESATYTNPIFAGDYADPSILKVGEEFYITHTSFRYAPGLLIWRSRDLIHWTPVVRALQEYDGEVWAPDLICYKKRFYIYYPSLSKTHGTVSIHVICADRIEGPWSKPVDLQIDRDMRPIDPGHIVGTDGKRYLHFAGGYLIELTEDGLAVVGAAKKVYEGWPIPPTWRVEGFYLESPKPIFRDGWYHLFSAQGGTGGPSTSHMAVEARARSPLGPWENSPLNPVVHTASRLEKWWSRGHGTVFEAFPGSWWMVYHGYDRENLSLGRQTLMEPIEWTPEGWARVPAGVNPALPINTPPVAPAPVPPLERSDEFAGPQLGLQWQFWGEFDPERVQFSNHSLVMAGKGSSPADCGPLACMAGDDAYEVTVEVEVEEGVQAGLILFYNPQFYAGVGLTKECLWAGEHGQLKKKRPMKSGNRQFLKIVNDHGDVDFLAGPSLDTLTKVNNSINVSGYTNQTLGGFLSLRPALYSTGKGQAIFRHFSYKRLDESPSPAQAIEKPTKEEMRSLAQRICNGDRQAFETLRATVVELYRAVPNSDPERFATNYELMREAFDLLGQEAGKGNESAFAGLKDSLPCGSIMHGFALDSIGIAAAGGHKEALSILLKLDESELLSERVGAMMAPASANIEPAVDFLIHVLRNPNNRPLFNMASDGLKGAAQKGNAKAQAALDELAKAEPKAEEAPAIPVTLKAE